MCLFVENTDRLCVAENDMPMFKVVLASNHDKEHWRGVFYRDKLFKFDSVVKESDFELESMGRKTAYVKGGCFHSANDLSYVQRIFKETVWLDGYPYSPFVCKAVIPKGTEYYKGVDSIEYASKKIIVQNPYLHGVTKEVYFYDIFACIVLLKLNKHKANEPKQICIETKFVKKVADDLVKEYPCLVPFVDACHMNIFADHMRDVVWYYNYDKTSENGHVWFRNNQDTIKKLFNHANQEKNIDLCRKIMNVLKKEKEL